MDATHRVRTAMAAAVIVCVAFVGCKRSEEMVVRKLNPRVGATQGDQPVKVEGRNFRGDLGYTVYFGHKKAESVTIVDTRTLMVVAPRQHRQGSVDVTVRSDDGVAYRIREGFRYVDMRGSVVGRLGESPTSPAKRGNLAY